MSGPRLVYDPQAWEGYPDPARYKLTLPFPPSVNKIWKWVRRQPGRGSNLDEARWRVARSGEYQLWLKACDGCVLEQLGIPAYRRTIPGRYTITVTLCITRWKSCDQDNTLKGISDLLQRSRVISDDKNAWITMVSWGQVDGSHKDRPLCHVEINEI